MESITQTDAAESSAIWLPPLMASPPKQRITTYSSTVSTASGTADTHGEGSRSSVRFAFIGFSDSITAGFRSGGAKVRKKHYLWRRNDRETTQTLRKIARFYIDGFRSA